MTNVRAWATAAAGLLLAGCASTQAQAPAKDHASTPPATSTVTGCHPLTAGGKCYEPGEYCRAADHGTSGVAGNGKVITCKNNGGWHWETARAS